MKPRFALICCLFLLAGCHSTEARTKQCRMSSINILDHNGLSETINSKERLSAFEKTDFLAPQPYQKVMRVYGREKNGDVRSQITSYYPNGQIKQYLEALNHRAYGMYREWFANGQVKIDAQVIGGVADLNTQAEDGWVFEGQNRAFDEDGNLRAEIFYIKGSLEGASKMYHKNGVLWKATHYHKNLHHGTEYTYLADATLFQTTEYKEGKKHGPSTRYWSEDALAYHEDFSEGKLNEAVYYNLAGQLVAEVKAGTGKRAIFGKSTLLELQEIKGGVQEGSVTLFNEDGDTVSSFYIQNGVKHGEEVNYFPGTTRPQLAMSWENGALQGPVKTWFDNGQLESLREMSQNKKNGLLTAWYRDGGLMLVEEYDRDTLVKGEYYRMGEKIPVSKVEKGSGIATLFNGNGGFTHKTSYHEGHVVE